MSSRPFIKPHHLVVDQVLGASFNSDATILTNLSMISYDISWSGGGSPVGAVTIQVSNTYSLNADGSVRDAGNWTTLTLSSPVAISGNSGNGMIDVDATGAYAMRMVYTRTSGTATMNVTVAAKVA